MTLMIGTKELAKRIYGAWRDAAPNVHGLPPVWEALTITEQARWRYVAEQAADEIATAAGAKPAA